MNKNCCIGMNINVVAGTDATDLVIPMQSTDLKMLNLVKPRRCILE